MIKIGKFMTIGSFYKIYNDILENSLGYIKTNNSGKKEIERFAKEKDFNIENSFKIIEEIKNKEIDFDNIPSELIKEKCQDIKEIFENEFDIFIENYKKIIIENDVRVSQEELDSSLVNNLYLDFIKTIIYKIYINYCKKTHFNIYIYDLKKRLEEFKKDLLKLIEKENFNFLKKENEEGTYRFIQNLEKNFGSKHSIDIILNFISELEKNITREQAEEIFLFFTAVAIEINLYKFFKINIKDIDHIIKNNTKKQKIAFNEEYSNEFSEEENLISELREIIENLTQENLEPSKLEIEKIIHYKGSEFFQFNKFRFYGKFLVSIGKRKEGLEKYLEALSYAKYRAGEIFKELIKEGMILAITINSQAYKKFYNYARLFGIISGELKENDWIYQHYQKDYPIYFKELKEAEVNNEKDLPEINYVIYSSDFIEQKIDRKGLSIKDLRSPNAKYKYGPRYETRLSIFSMIRANDVTSEEITYTEEYIQICIKELLSKGADINFVDSTGETALMKAICFHNYERALLLLDYPEIKRSINQISLVKKNTALSVVLEHLTEITELNNYRLLKELFSQRKKARDISSIFEYLMQETKLNNKDKELLKELFIKILKFEPDINKIVTTNETTYLRQLMNTFIKRDISISEIFREDDIDNLRRAGVPGITDDEVMEKKNLSAPFMAEYFNRVLKNHRKTHRTLYLEMIDILLKAGADINIKQKCGISDLMFTSEIGDIQLFELLNQPRYKPDFETVTDKNKNLFINAVDWENFDFAIYLLEKISYFKKDINYKIGSHTKMNDLFKIKPGDGIEERHAKKGMEDLCNNIVLPESLVIKIAKDDYNSEKIKKLILMGADVNSSTYRSNSSLLHLAISNNDKEMVQFLLENGADVNHKLDTSRSVEFKYGRLLYDKISDSDYKSKMSLLEGIYLNGVTPVMAAVHKGNLEIVKLLIKYKAALHARTIDGKNIFDFVEKSKNNELFECLVKNF